MMAVLLVYMTIKCEAGTQQGMQHLQQLEQHILVQSKQITGLLNQYRESSIGQHDWILSHGIWIHEFDVLDSLRLGINSIKLYLAIDNTDQRALFALVTHQNLYIASQLCTEHAIEIGQYRKGLKSVIFKTAVHQQFEQAKQACQVLRQLGEELYSASQ